MTMTIVCIFPDRATSESAIQDLVRRGVAPSALTCHRSTATAANADRLEIDELITGGLITNMRNLLDGLFEHHVPPGSAATLGDVIRTEGTLVSVDVANLSEAQQCTEWLHRAGALRSSTLPATDTVSFHRLYPALA